MMHAGCAESAGRARWRWRCGVAAITALLSLHPTLHTRISLLSWSAMRVAEFAASAIVRSSVATGLFLVLQFGWT